MSYKILDKILKAVGKNLRKKGLDYCFIVNGKPYASFMVGSHDEKAFVKYVIDALAGHYKLK